MSTNDIEWWEDSRRPCKDKPEYSDPALIDVGDAPGARERKRRMIRELALSCHYCPVRRECAADMLRYPDGEQYGIRAGIVRL